MNSIIYKSYLLRTNPIIRKIIINKYKSPLKFYNKIYQNGGSNEMKINYNNEIFTFYEFEENYWALRDINDNDCVTIGIDPIEKEAFINNINADTVKCGNTILTNQGSHLFKITLNFLIDNKDKFGINKIKLTDNAVKNCPNSKRINLGFFLTLLTGETWYGKYGFRPIDSDYKKHYRYNREIMNTVTINDINMNEIIEMLLNKKEIKEKQYTYYIKIYNKYKKQNILVKDFLTKIFKKDIYDKMCNIFNYLHQVISQKLNLQINYLITGVVYELNI
jgi:hypothetical protein